MPSCSIHPLPYCADPAIFFERVRHAPGAVLLDAGRPTAERGRFDLISAWPQLELTPRADESGKTFFQRLRQALKSLGSAKLPEDHQLPFAGGLIGYLSYDFGRRLEQLPSQARDDLGLADARFGLYAWALISDHQHATSQLLFHPSMPAAERERLVRLFGDATTNKSPPCFRLTSSFGADQDPASYRSAIERIQQYIAAGDCYQINFAQRFQASCQGDPWTAYRALRQACPTPFAGYLQLDAESALLSLSPERFLRVSAGLVETRPIKGTRPRLADPQADLASATELLSSSKDRAENLMIVDLLRNDLGRSCAIGSVRVPELFSLESYPNVHHLTSCVTGRLADGQDALDLLAGSFPGGSITGAPKVRAMEIIAELEPTARGPYCGSLAYLGFDGTMDASILIRTITAGRGWWQLPVGGGIVAQSDPDDEYRETWHKARGLLRALA